MCEKDYSLTFNEGKNEVIFEITENASLKCKNSEILREANVSTGAELFDVTCKRFASRKCLGIRKTLEKRFHCKDDGKELEKLVLDDKYTWSSYQEIHEKVDNIAKGLHVFGLNPGDKVIMYADTCMEWFLATMACFKSSVIIGTLYTTLGDEALVFGVKQLSANVIITSHKLLGNILSLKENIPDVSKIIVIDGTFVSNGNNLEITTFEEIEKKGIKESKTNLKAPEENEEALIMFTSGSGGDPKGVVITHQSLLGMIYYSSCPGFCHLIHCYEMNSASEDETYIAYLPMAHILEFSISLISFAMGIKIGFSSPFRLTPMGLSLVPGQKGDLEVLQPTCMLAVPAILNKIYKGLQAKVGKKGALFAAFFDYCVKAKMKARRKGKTTAKLDKFVFAKTKQAVGGRLKIIACGGAPLNSEVQEYLQALICDHIVQGYGSTEVNGGVTLGRPNPKSYGQVGIPSGNGIQIKLRSWQEGGYSVLNKNGPQGEILINAPCVAKEYFNLPEATKEAFIMDENGSRWFCSGDVGFFDVQDEVFRVIDRKKDLIKLQMGEYVSLSKVESCLKIHQIVEMVCVIVNPLESFCVALIIPEANQLSKMCEGLGLNNLSYGQACGTKLVAKLILEQLLNHAKHHLKRFEIPQRIALISDVWTPESGLMTTTMKPKRKAIENKYKDVIEILYKQK